MLLLGLYLLPLLPLTTRYLIPIVVTTVFSLLEAAVGENPFNLPFRLDLDLEAPTSRKCYLLVVPEWEILLEDRDNTVIGPYRLFSYPIRGNRQC